MIVVSDTTPLRHLIAIGEAELLPRLYRTVIVPGAVWAELQAEAVNAESGGPGEQERYNAIEEDAGHDPR